MEGDIPWKASRLEEAPVRRGWLKHGNPPGDFSKAPQCGAKNRRQTPCLRGSLGISQGFPKGRCEIEALGLRIVQIDQFSESVGFMADAFYQG
jgi:hypothetical protein